MKLLQGLKLLEEAYNTKDWDSVKISYSLISGEELLDIGVDEESLKTAKKVYTKANTKRGRPKKVKEERPFNPKNPGNFKADMSLQKEPDEPIKREPQRTRTTSIKFVKNTFVDDGKLATEDRLIDKKLSKGWKRSEVRPAHKSQLVGCSSKGCREKVEVDPGLYLPDTSYFCNTCLNKKG